MWLDSKLFGRDSFVIITSLHFNFFFIFYGAKTMPFAAFFFNFQDSWVITNYQVLSICFLTNVLIEILRYKELVSAYYLTSDSILFVSSKASLSILWNKEILFAWYTFDSWPIICFRRKCCKGDLNLYPRRKVLFFPRIGLYHNSLYHKTIWGKTHSFFELLFSAQTECLLNVKHDQIFAIQ